MDERRVGLIVILLQSQLFIAGLMTALGAIGGSFLFTFSQLPGGIIDAGTSEPGEDSALFAILFHLLSLITLGLLMRAVHSNSDNIRPWAGAHLVASIFSMPFGIVLAVIAWRLTETDSWDDGLHYASGVGPRMRILLGGAWLLTTLVAGIATLGAYVGFLSGGTLGGVLLLISAVAIQFGAIVGLQLLQTRLKTKTFGSPMPEMPHFGP